eukprot:m.326646 g.326646  ORF g.326646 m.326646 type:complete len:854 (+) comp19743_c1_seq2:115-2676(+)
MALRMVVAVLAALSGVVVCGTPPAPDPATCQAVTDPVDCSSGVGSPHSGAVMTEELCAARGCCYSDTAPNCRYPTNGERISVVHMINSNHFDAGYADLTAVVFNKYFDEYFPRAAQVGAELRKLPSSVPGSGPLRWMTFSFLLSLYFDCPPDLGLHCPSAADQATIEAAIKAEDIVWAAFPHNAELALGDAAMLQFGINISTDLANRFGVSPPTVLSTRDVPGMPRASLPILKNAGITAVSEGMNGRIVPVNVPPAFVWTYGGVDMPTLWHWHGYGQLGDPGDPIRVPGSSHALAYVWRGDNAGPPMNAQEVLDNAKALLKQFDNTTATSWVRRTGHRHRYGGFGQPTSAQQQEHRHHHEHHGSKAENARADNATAASSEAAPTVSVVSSSLERFVAAVSAEKPSPWDTMPKVTQDLSDSWVWGAASDPVKLQRTRAIHRARTDCERAAKPGVCDASDSAYVNMSRIAIKNMEHTWGVSVSHYKKEADTHWANRQFHADLAKNESDLAFLASSWVEQRDWGINKPLGYLPASHPVRKQVEHEIAAMDASVAPNPAAIGFVKAGDPTKPITDLGVWAVAQVGSDGSLVRLQEATSAASWASPSHPLGLLRYQTLVLDNFTTWQQEYLISGSGGQNEYGKPSSFMRAIPKPLYNLAAPTVKAVWTKKAAPSSHSASVWVQVEFDASLVQDYGAPQEAWLQYEFDVQTMALNATVLLLNKTATRLPEATWFTFDPKLNDDGGSVTTWEHSILGSWHSAFDVADGAAKGLHYVDEAGVRMNDTKTGNMQAKSIDAGLLRYGPPLPFPTPLHGNVSLAEGASFCLHNNIWNTNYPFWMPFDDVGASLKFRFALLFPNA